MKCNIQGCDNTNIAARGMCHKHYARQRRHGNTDDPEYINKGKICSVPDCNIEAHTRGLCIKHHVRWLNHQDVHMTLKPASYEGHVCIIRGCDERVRGEQLCNKHLYNYKYHLKKGNLENIQQYVQFREKKDKGGE